MTEPSQTGRSADVVGAGQPEAGSRSAELRDSTVSGSVVQAGEVQGGVHFYMAERRAVRPRELPPPPAAFTDREAEAAWLDRFAAEAAGSDLPLVAVVSGIGGVGKTALLLHWLHRRRAHFPDGQFYLDLRGCNSLEAMAPGAAVGRLLRSLGVAPDRVPAGLDESAGLFRTLTAGRRVAVLADNALSPRQVRALLPGAGASLVAVTSRRRLPGLVGDGARFLDLSPLDEGAAADLLEHLVGPERARADPEAVRELAEACGRLPIAIGAVAARMARRRFLTPDRIVRELRALSEKPRRLAVPIPEEHITVHTIFDQSYAELSDPAAALYRRLGLLPGPTFTPAVAAVLIDPEPAAGPEADPGADPGTDPGTGTKSRTEPGTGRGTEVCEPLLDELLGLRLVEEVDDTRFRLLDPARTHAAEKAEHIDPAERTALLRRVVAWYLARAASADRYVLPGRERIGPAAEAARQEPDSFTSAAEALDWLEAELPNLMATLRAANSAGFHEIAWQMCEALWGLFVSRRPYPERVDAGEIGLVAARACGDERAHARMLAQLGVALVDLRRLEEAQAHFTESLRLARATGNRLGEASAVNQLGLIRLAADRADDAIPYFVESRELHAAAGSPRGAALVTRRLGEAHRNAGRHHEAVGYFRDALVRFTAMGDQYNILVCSLGLALAHIGAGDPQLALDPLGHAQQIAHAEGAVYQAARVHQARADAHEALGDPATARSALLDALPLLERLREPTEHVRDRIRRLAGDPT